MSALKNVSAGEKTFKIGAPTRLLHSLRPHPDNPREEISRDDPEIQKMADSIIEYGIIEPLVITPDNFIIAGHRRRMASLVAFEKTNEDKFLVAPVVVREIDPASALELMLQENMQRQSLTPLEEARAMYGVMERRKLTVSDLARVIAVPAPTCSARLAILKCEPHVQRLYAKNDLPLHAAAVLARVHDADKQVRYAGMIARRELTLPKLKEMLQQQQGKGAQPEKIIGGGYNSNFKPDLTERAEDIPRPQPIERKRRAPGAGDKGPMTRAEAMASLDRAVGKKISVVALRSIFNAQCCACGMSGEAEVCQSCPLPRVISGIAGRAEV